jgi:ADP-ribose pyrophosphatase YjhB (NUDIX family)
METLPEALQFIKQGYLDYRPGLVIDCAIFGYHEGELQLLLVKNKILTMWCLPGGFVKKKENLDQAAARISSERTGISNLFLQQFKTFGDPGRNDPRGAFDQAKFSELTGETIRDDTWLVADTVSVGFYAISDVINAQPKADFFSSECRWFPVNKLPALGFDHKEMVNEALHAMRIHLYHFPIGKNLLPEKFTLKEIKQFYEVMSGKPLHITNFPNKLISIGLIKKTNEKRRIGAHRSPSFYRFNQKIYQKALKEGLVLV